MRIGTDRIRIARTTNAFYKQQIWFSDAKCRCYKLLKLILRPVNRMLGSTHLPVRNCTRRQPVYSTICDSCYMRTASSDTVMFQRSGEAVTGDQIKLADGAMKLNCNIRP